EFWGFDMQTPDVAEDSVRAFVARADPAFLPTVDSAYALVDSAEAGMRRNQAAGTASASAWRDAAARIMAHLAANRTSYLARFDAAEVDWAEQNARIVEQAAS